MTRTFCLRLLAFPILAGIGCFPRGTSIPQASANVATTGATVTGPVGADYAVPPAAPSGDVRLASYGAVDIWPTDRPRPALHALHLRVVITNDSAATWTFDIRNQRLELRGGMVLAPAFASANAGMQPPLVTVAPNGTRVADIFFLLPADLQDAERLPAFDALWEVRTNSDLVKERTPLDRLLVEPEADPRQAANYGPGYYWGEPYWMNPSSSGGFRDEAPFIRLAPHQSADQFFSR